MSLENDKAEALKFFNKIAVEAVNFTNDAIDESETTTSDDLCKFANRTMDACLALIALTGNIYWSMVYTVGSAEIQGEEETGNHVGFEECIKQELMARFSHVLDEEYAEGMREYVKKNESIN